MPQKGKEKLRVNKGQNRQEEPRNPSDGMTPTEGMNLIMQILEADDVTPYFDLLKAVHPYGDELREEHLAQMRRDSQNSTLSANAPEWVPRTTNNPTGYHTSPPASVPTPTSAMMPPQTLMPPHTLIPLQTLMPSQTLMPPQTILPSQTLISPRTILPSQTFMSPPTFQPLKTFIPVDNITQQPTRMFVPRQPGGVMPWPAGSVMPHSSRAIIPHPPDAFMVQSPRTFISNQPSHFIPWAPASIVVQSPSPLAPQAITLMHPIALTQDASMQQLTDKIQQTSLTTRESPPSSQPSCSYSRNNNNGNGFSFQNQGNTPRFPTPENECSCQKHWIKCSCQNNKKGSQNIGTQANIQLTAHQKRTLQRARVPFGGTIQTQPPLKPELFNDTTVNFPGPNQIGNKVHFPQAVSSFQEYDMWGANFDLLKCIVPSTTAACNSQPDNVTSCGSPWTVGMWKNPELLQAQNLDQVKKDEDSQISNLAPNTWPSSENTLNNQHNQNNTCNQDYNAAEPNFNSVQENVRKSDAKMTYAGVAHPKFSRCAMHRRNNLMLKHFFPKNYFANDPLSTQAFKKAPKIGKKKLSPNQEEPTASAKNSVVRGLDTSELSMSLPGPSKSAQEFDDYSPNELPEMPEVEENEPVGKKLPHLDEKIAKNE